MCGPSYIYVSACRAGSLVGTRNLVHPLECAAPRMHRGPARLSISGVLPMALRPYGSIFPANLQRRSWDHAESTSGCEAVPDSVHGNGRQSSDFLKRLRVGQVLNLLTIRPAITASTAPQEIRAVSFATHVKCYI